MLIEYIYQVPYNVTENHGENGYSFLFTCVREKFSIIMEEFHSDNNNTYCRGQIFLSEQYILVEVRFVQYLTIKQLEKKLFDKLRKYLDEI